MPMRAPSLLTAIISATTICCFTAQAVQAAPAEGSASPSPGGDTSDYSEAAVAAFERGDYDAAIENFERAFAIDDNPNNLFNIGRVYEESGDLEAAVEYYKQFIAQPGVSLDFRKTALDRIDVLEKTIAATKAAEEPAPEPAPAPAPEPEPQPQQVEASPTSDDVDHRRKQRIAGAAVLGIGAAVLIGGGVVGGLTPGVKSNLDASTAPSERDALAARGRTLATTADALYIAGGTLALVGLIVTLTALPKKGAGRTALAPTFDTRGAGLVLTHRF